MGTLNAYRNVERRQAAELQNWIDRWAHANPELQRRMAKTLAGRKVSKYAHDQRHQFAVIARLGLTLGHPEAGHWEEEYHSFAELKGYLD